MFEHKWLTNDEIKSIREEYGPPYASNELTNEVDRLLADLAAAKALLGKCLPWMDAYKAMAEFAIRLSAGHFTLNDEHVNQVNKCKMEIAEVTACMARIRAVPGVEAKA